MKNTVRVIIFLIILAVICFILRDVINSGVLQYFSILITLSVVFIGFLIFLENRHPTQTLTWLIVFASFPLVGFVFYFLFGRHNRKERKFRKKYLLDQQTYLRIESDFNATQKDKNQQLKEHQRKLFTLAHRLGKTPISFATKTKVLTNGEETFSQILLALKKAEHHIHLEYYIVRDDQIGQNIKQILIEKANEGVKVRFLYDAVGSWKLSKTYIHELQMAGVEIVAFGPVHLPFLNSKFNYRNHRKIVVIDGTIGFVGGLNIGDEYLGKVESFGFWRDTHLMLKGEAVRTLQLIFLQDWFYMTGKSFLTPEYFSPDLEEKIYSGVQLISGGPDNKYSVIKDIFFSMITSASKSVWIASPYFIPDEDIFSALKIAALSGIDVRILVPKQPDKWIVFYASRSYFPELLEAGVKIFEYEKGFMHSKIVIVDGELASIGTSNMDLRSFHLNFEVNAFLFRTESTNTLVIEYEKDLLDSKQLTIESFSERKFGFRLLESTCRLLSPLL